MVTQVPVTLITGPLGIGKTTALLSLLRRRPAGGRWAVLVNEFGQVGIDGARLSSGGDYEVREVAGGCVCCTAGPLLHASLARLLREVKPDRLLIEPSGLARPSAVLDVLSSPGIAPSVSKRAVITLVDPRQFTRRVVDATDDALAEQLAVADVLVGHQSDRCTEAELAAFREAAAGLVPEKLVVAERCRGDLDLAWLDLDPAPPAAAASRPALRLLEVPTPAASFSRAWPSDRAFDRGALEQLVEGWLNPVEGDDRTAESGLARIKGMVRLTEPSRAARWLALDGTPGRLDWSITPWRRDNRLVVIADTSGRFDVERAAIELERLLR